MSETRYPSSVPSPFCIPREGRRRNLLIDLSSLLLTVGWVPSVLRSHNLVGSLGSQTRTLHHTLQASAAKAHVGGKFSFAHTRHVAHSAAHMLRYPQVRKVLIIGLVFPFLVLFCFVAAGSFQKKLTLPVSSVSRLSPLVQISLTEASTTQRPITVFSVSKIKFKQK